MPEITGISDTPKVPAPPSTVSEKLQQSGFFINYVPVFHGNDQDLVRLPDSVKFTTPEQATQQIEETAKLCDQFDERMKNNLNGIDHPSEIIIGDVHRIISHPVEEYSFSAFSLVSLLAQHEYDENRINAKANTLSRFKQMKNDEFSPTLRCVGQMRDLLNAKPDQLYAYTYFARRKLEQMIQKQKTSSGLTNLSLEELKKSPEGKRANSVLKELLGKHDRIKQLLTALEKSTLLKQKPAHIEGHIDPLIN